MIELTRELLERYLRGTGWSTQCDIIAKVQHYVDQGYYIENAIAAIIGAEHVYRLGLCAAAEHIFGIIRWIEKNGTGPDCALIAHAQRLRALEFLSAAGVDPAKWETARAR